MQIESEKTENGVCFTVRGSLSGSEHSTKQLFEAVSASLDSNPGTIWVDIGHVAYIDSMSIGLLVGILLKCQEKDIPFRLQNVPRHLADVLDNVKLKKMFPDLY